MRKLISLLMLFALLSLVGMSTGCSKVESGHVGVKVYLLGGDKGVDNEVLTPGRYWIGWNEDLFIFPTFKQNYVWTQSAVEGSPNDESISFQTIEGMEANGDFGISYKVNPDKVSTLFQEYRMGLGEITDIYLRNTVRDALVMVSSKMKVESVYGAGKAKMMADVNTYVREAVADKGIEVENIYMIGSLRLPTQVTEALDRKIAATQKAEQRENELRATEAEAKKVKAEAVGKADAEIELATGYAKAVRIRADAEADANKKIAASLTPALLEKIKYDKWGGTVPQVMSGATPIIDLR